MYSYKTGLGQVWVGSKLPPNPANNIIWLRPSDDHRVLWEIRTYNIYKERWEVLTSAALTADGLLILIRDLEKRCKSLEELKVVLYDTIQNLTPEEQKIARQNIGAISLEDLHLDENVVSFNIDQSSVSNDKKNKALGNIGIDFVRLPYSLLGTTLSDEMANVINNARGIILVDTPNDFILPTIYNKGRTTSSNAKFITIGETKDVYYILYNKNTKALANVVHTYTDNGCVRYVQEQNLTNTEKDTVLSNIGLDFVQVDYSLLGTTLTDEMFAVLDNAKGIILVDPPSGYYNPRVFIKGNNGSTGCFFVSFATGTTYCQIELNKSTKVLSGVNAGLTYGGSVRYTEEQSLTDTQKQQARANINAVGSSMIKGVEIVYGTAPMQEDNILYIELEETT